MYAPVVQEIEEEILRHSEEFGKTGMLSSNEKQLIERVEADMEYTVVSNEKWIKSFII